MELENKTLSTDALSVGYHPEGFRIDKTAMPMYRYTRWTVDASGKWINPEPVCFSSLPVDGWYEVDGFDWNDGCLNSRVDFGM